MKKVKVKVTWEFELPFEAKKGEDECDAKGSVIQNVFDELVNYAICKHLEDSLNWFFKAKGNKKSSAYLIHKDHKFWADLLRNAETNGKVKYEVELPKEPTKMYWIKGPLNDVCPLCGVTLRACAMGEFCSEEKGGCGKYCDGYATLTKKEAKKFKDVILA
jgi:hypothetical protein